MTRSDPIVVRLLAANEIALLDRVAADVFDHPLDPRWSAEFLADPRHHLAVALAGDLVVGMASALHYVHPDKAPELWMNEVGVAPAYRRRGVGRRLVAALLEHGRALGCREAWLLTEQENVAARGLYRSAGGVEAERPVYITFELEKRRTT